MRGIRSTTEALERCACSTAAGDSYSKVKYYCKRNREREKTPRYISRDHISEAPACQSPKSFLPLLLHSKISTSKPPTAPVAPEPGVFCQERRRGQRQEPRERVLSNLMLIREAWKAARSRWLGTHDQMSTHFLETNIYK